jgi:hypothetical protein
VLCLMTLGEQSTCFLPSTLPLLLPLHICILLDLADIPSCSPTIGTLVALSPEEVVITPAPLEGKPARVDVRVHFPRLGFVVRPYKPKTQVKNDQGMVGQEKVDSVAAKL